MRPFSMAAHARLVLLVAALFAGTLMPGGLKQAVEGQLWSQVPWSGLAHFALFAAIAFTALREERLKPWLVLLGAAALAITTEYLQQWVPGRHPRAIDLGIDMAGAISGLLAAYWAGRRVPAREAMDCGPGPQ